MGEYIRTFKTSKDFYDNKEDLVSPYVSYIKDTGKIILSDTSPIPIEYVDLGFPSKTKWATMNLGANYIEEDGLYFSWGNIKGRYYGERNTYFSDDNYSSDLNGNIPLRDSSYDAAQSIKGGSWKIPDKADFLELINNTTNFWTTVNGKVGRLFVSKYNGKSIFLPASGYIEDDSINDINSIGAYWSTRSIDSSEASIFVLESGEIRTDNYSKYLGLTIRPIMDDTVIEPVDLGLPSGLLWANMNIGATTETDAGKYFSWGNTVGYYSDEEYDFSGIDWDEEIFAEPYASTPGAELSDDIPVNVRYDAARANLGKTWRMPTQAEFQELYDECTWTWTTRNNVNGYLVTSNATGNTNSIFLPAAGYRYEDSIYDVGSGGRYWSSSLSDEWDGYYLGFDSGGVNPGSNFDRCDGFPVRAVQ